MEARVLHQRGLVPQATSQASNDGALPAVGYAAAGAALRYGVAQSWIQDETTHRSVNIQEAVDRVAHTGGTEVALHTEGCHGGLAEGIVVELTGMVPVMAADMVRGVLHASRVRSAHPQGTFQLYTPPRALLFSTSAVLAIMWHLAREDTPKGTAKEIASEFHAWRATRTSPAVDPKAVSQWRPRRKVQPRGNPPATPRQKGAPLPADRSGRPTRLRMEVGHRRGTTAAAPLDSPTLVPAQATQAVKGLSNLHGPPAPPCSAACRRGGPGFLGETMDARAHTFPWCKGKPCSTPKTWGTWNGGRLCATLRADE